MFLFAAEGHRSTSISAVALTDRQTSLEASKSSLGKLLHSSVVLTNVVSSTLRKQLWKFNERVLHGL